MQLNFTKMHGLGNDFIVINALEIPFSLNRDQIRTLSDRHTGIGFDQLLVIEPARNNNIDFRYRIFNADGGEVEQCGNGARCFARYVHDNNLSDKTELTVETVKGPLLLKLESNGEVTVDMGVPEFEPAMIPFNMDQRRDRYSLQLDETTIEIGVVSMGNPHAVLEVENIQTAAVAQLGPAIESHKAFPRRVNAGFMQIISPDEIALRVYERGTGETMACGSGACAAVAVGRLWQKLNQTVQVHLTGGTLVISWAGEGQPVLMTGPATTVFEGTITL